MRLRDKLIALCALAAAVPLATAGLLTVRWSQDALEREIKARHEAVAHHAARAVAADVGSLLSRLDRAASLFPWERLSSEELRGALALVGHEDQRVRSVALFDADARILQTVGSGPADALGRRAPLGRALAEGPGAIVVSAVSSCPERPAPCLAVALPRSGPSGRPLIVAAEIELSELGIHLAREADRARLTVVDAEGHVVADTGPSPSLPGSDQRARPPVRDFVAGLPGGGRRFVDGGRVVFAATAPVGSLGWGVVVERDADEAFGSARRLRLFTLGWTLVATALAVLVSALFARRLTRALGELAEAARRLGGGELSHRVTVRGHDEVADLGNTLNAMGREIEASREEILRFNRELEDRVEARTRELKEAQAQLLQAQKLAALGQLGAGVAHEINNPLGAVIGHAQLLLLNRAPDDKDAAALRCIEEGARRASEIVKNLLRFSVQHAEAVRSVVDLNALLRDTLTLTERLLLDTGIAIEWKLAQPPPRALGDQGQLAQVVLNLVANARTAMKERGGTLTLETFAEAPSAPSGPGPRGDAAAGRDAAAERRPVGFRVRDTGTGIPAEILGRIFEPFFTTKAEWSNVGLGLSVSYRIVEDHGGRIEVESAVGSGSVFTVYLPAA